jgi:hypothetical protein
MRTGWAKIHSMRSLESGARPGNRRRGVFRGNADQYAALWHDKFLGWPRERDRPVDKGTISRSAKKKMTERRVSNYDFLYKGVTVTGNIGGAQYALRWFA